MRLLDSFLWCLGLAFFAGYACGAPPDKPTLPPPAPADACPPAAVVYVDRWVPCMAPAPRVSLPSLPDVGPAHMLYVHESTMEAFVDAVGAWRRAYEAEYERCADLSTGQAVRAPADGGP
jgi:hypothetical protein